MTKKLNCILLIDDDEATNFIHKRVIREADCAEKVVAVQSGDEGLDYLKSREDGEHPRPDLIFLDVNMPGIDGWEFLEAYNALEKEQKGRIIIVMLTTSLNPDDRERASQIETINSFKNKPLTVPMLSELIDTYFPDTLE